MYRHTTKEETSLCSYKISRRTATPRLLDPLSHHRTRHVLKELAKADCRLSKVIMGPAVDNSDNTEDGDKDMADLPSVGKTKLWSPTENRAVSIHLRFTARKVVGYIGFFSSLPCRPQSFRQTHAC